LALSEILISLFLLLLIILEATRLLLFDVHLLPMRLLRGPNHTFWILPRWFFWFFLIPLDPLLRALLTLVDELLLLLTRVSSMLAFGSLGQLVPSGRSILAAMINSYVFIRAFIVSVTRRRMILFLFIAGFTVFLFAGTLLRDKFILIRSNFFEHSVLYLSLVFQ
jgi:hypothetical protein